MAEEKCLIQLFDTEGVNFLGRGGECTDDIQEIFTFKDELEAYIYIDKHGLTKLSKVRRIVLSENEELTEQRNNI